MTVSNTTDRTSAVGTNTVGQEVPFEFPITNTSDVVVKTRVTTSGAEATLDETTNYTVDISGTEGGTVTMITAVDTDSEIHVIRDTPNTQALDLEQGGDFSAENIESALDKLTKLVIDNSERLDRTLRMPDTDDGDLVTVIPNSVARADLYVSFDSSGNVTATSLGDAGVVSFGLFGIDVAATADEAAFKLLANLEIGTDVQAYSAQLLAIAALTPTNSYFMVGNGTTWVRETGNTVRASLGISTYWGTVLDDTTAAASRATLEITEMDDILCWEEDVLCWEGDVLTWKE